jgi:hypothetical protein
MIVAQSIHLSQAGGTGAIRCKENITALLLLMDSPASTPL